MTRRSACRCRGGLALAFASATAAANPAPGHCEALRAQIEARIRAAGVASFSVTVVPVDAPADGKVVGQCDRGSRKIVYARSAGATPAAPTATPAAASASAAARREAPVLTECKDGSVRYGGDCPR